MNCAHCKHDLECAGKGRDCHGGRLEIPRYEDPDVWPLAAGSALLQHLYGNNLTRLQELVFFGGMLGCERIGLVYCAGLEREARALAEVLSARFTVGAVRCGRCLTPDGAFLPDPRTRFDVYARGVPAEAEELNALAAPLNVSLGLCLEQEILVNRHSRAPVTCFAAPDWVLGHHPLGVVYGSYQRNKYLRGPCRPGPGHFRRTRLEDLILFCELAGLRRICLGFCNGLFEEARALSDILSRHLEVFSVCCKNGGIDKKSLDIPYMDPRAGFESACNPLGQARVAERLSVDLVVMVGICLGHDCLLATHSPAPAVTFAPKDRVLGHNPLAALYCGARALDADYSDPRPLALAHKKERRKEELKSE